MAKYPRGTGGGISPIVTGQAFGPARQKWRELVAAKVATGLSRAQAVSAVSKQNPGLRQRMVEEANR